MINEVRSIMTLLLMMISVFSSHATIFFSGGHSVRYITMDDGLPHNFVQDMLRDSNGFIWIATGGGGLARYDGYEFLTFSAATSVRPLKGNYIYNVCEDRFNRLWIASDRGVDVLSLITLSGAMPSDKSLLPYVSSTVSSVATDANGDIWINADYDIVKVSFDENGQVMQCSTYRMPYKPLVTFIMKDVDGDGSMWCGISGTVFKLVADGNGKLRAEKVSNQLDLPIETYFTDFISHDNDVWISTNQGLYRYNANENTVKHYENLPGDEKSLLQNYITDMVVTVDKRLVLSCLRGLSIYNPAKDNFDRISQDTKGAPLNNYFITGLLADNNSLWVATEGGGVNRISSTRITSKDYIHDSKNPGSISKNPVNALYEDVDGTLWVGTVEGGLNRLLAGMTTFSHYTAEQGKLTHNSVSAIAVDGDDNLWVGTWGGGLTVLDRKNPDRVKMMISTSRGCSEPIDFVGSLTYDKINRLIWIGSNQGVYIYDIVANKLLLPDAKYSAEIRGSIGSTIDRNNVLWLGSMNGLYAVDLKKRNSDGSFSFKHYNHKLNDESITYPERMGYLFTASDGTLWVGTNGHGIYKRVVTDGKEKFINYSTSNGLVNNDIRGIIEDSKGRLWLSTNNGLSCFYPSDGTSINFGENDGLISNQSYWNSTLRTSGGSLLFGTVAGLVAINGNVMLKPQTDVPIKFTRLYVNNEDVSESDKYVDRDVSFADKITMHERDKSFVIKFAALAFDENSQGRYAYKLEGFDHDWVEVDGRHRSARYTNLPYGTYNFKVRYAPDGRTWEKTEAVMTVVVKPYFYKTPLFLFISVIVVAGLMWTFVRWRTSMLIKNRRELESQVKSRTEELELQKHLVEERAQVLSEQNVTLKEQNEEISRQKSQLAEMNRQVNQLTVDRISFYTNITHEFRTPITLIMGPIRRALKLSYNPQVIEQLHFVERNSQYLLSLVNQLMDFRKLESGKVEIVRSHRNFMEFVDGLILPFDAMAADRNITIRRFCRFHVKEFPYDEEALRKVLTNLLSNAIKFTPEGGRIDFYAAMIPSCDTNNTNSTLYICIRDTGSGIAEGDIDHVFERFYQGKSEIKYPITGSAGSGIGLYLCKSIVEMYKSEIFARNNHGRGCSFRVFIPVGDADSEPAQPVGNQLQLPATEADSGDKDSDAAITVLVVDDNADMRSFIRSILAERYKVVEAANGQEALNILLERNIDFIVSDLMMPVMDGKSCRVV